MECEPSADNFREKLFEESFSLVQCACNEKQAREKHVKNIDDYEAVFNAIANDEEKKIVGAMLGCAYGDALGWLIELRHYSKESIQKAYPNGLKSFEDFNGYKNNQSKAIYTDDTQMTKLTLEVLIAAIKSKKSLNETMEQLACAYAYDYLDDPTTDSRAPGIQVKKACNALRTRIEEVAKKDLAATTLAQLRKNFGSEWWAIA